MDNFFPDNSIINISDAVIQDISTSGNSAFVTIFYTNCANCRPFEQTLRLIVSNRTLIFDEAGNSIPASDLRTGMTINAAFSSAMTRSIPPQTTAFMIRIVSRPTADSITTGRILDINRQNRSFTTISDGRRSTIIRFNTTPDTRFFDIIGRPMNFSGLLPGLRVRVRHADFLTASIPPQTTAFEVRIIR